MRDDKGPKLGVVIVGFRSDDVIIDCLESLALSEGVRLRIALVDNASPDQTAAAARAWATARSLTVEERDVPAGATADLSPDTEFALLRLPVNLGFAGGVNAGLRALLADGEIDLFWVLNPDCVATPGAALAFARHAAAAGPFSLMGGRTLFHEPPQAIQSDGGLVHRWTGVCSNVNRGRAPHAASAPSAATLDFISGANVVGSRAFIERAGLLQEDYFVFYEEVDWAMRRDDLPLTFCEAACVLHHGGTAIGSGSTAARATDFANYFNFRNRMRFMRRFHPARLPAAFVFSLLKIAKMWAVGTWPEAKGALLGLLGAPPPRSVRDRLSAESADIAFGRRKP